MKYTAIIKQDQGWWIGWVKEISGVNAQERTYEELIDSLKIVLKEALELNAEESLLNAGSDYKEEILKLNLENFYICLSGVKI